MKGFKRVVCFLLGLILLFSMNPLSYVMAAENEDTGQAENPVETQPPTTQPQLAETVPEETASTLPEVTEPTETEPTTPDETQPTETIPEETEPEEERTYEEWMETVDIGSSALDVEYQQLLVQDPSISTFALARSTPDGMYAQRALIWTTNGDELTFRYGNYTHTTSNVMMHAVYYNGAYRVAYCIEPGKSVIVGSDYDETEHSGDSVWGKLAYSKQRAVALAILYGAPNNMDSDDYKTKLAYQLATNVIIHEIILGWRQDSPPYALTDSTYYDIFIGTTAPLEVTCNGFYTSIHGQHLRRDEILDAYNAISNDLAAHDVVPSFASSFKNQAPTYTLAAQSNGTYAVTLKDTNGILSNYKFTNTSDLAFTKSSDGKSVTITTSNSNIGDVVVSTTKTVPNVSTGGSAFLIWNTPDSSQELCSLKEAKADPVPAYFKLTLPNGNIKVKKSTNTGSDLKGWKIGIYTDSKCTKAISSSPFTTNSSGEITATGLTAGTYYVKEIADADDYPYWDLDTSVKKVTVETGKTATATFNNTHYGRIKVTKTAVNGSAEGWSFQIINSSGKVVETIKTGSDGTATSSKLVPGKYTVREVKDRDGTYWTYDATVDKGVTVTAGSTSGVKYTNTQYGRIKVTKTAVNGSAEGWSFQIINSSGKVVETIKTGSDGTATSSKLAPGKYTVREVKDRDGTYWTYDATVEKGVTVKAGSTVSAKYTNTQYGRIKVTKTAVNGSAEGWSFQIINSSGKVVETIKTGSDGTATSSKLAPGKYTVREVKDRDGTYWTYDATVDKGVTVTAGSTSGVKYTNTQYGRIKVTKTAVNGSAEGWSFQIINSSGKVVETIKTDSDGTATSSKLTPGKYTVREVKDRDGTYWTYDATVDKGVTVTAGSTAGVKYTNTQYGRIKVTKTAVNGSAEGWSFQIINSSGKVVETIKTGSDGTATSSKLTPGKYTVREVKDRDGTYWTYDVNVDKGVTVTAGSTAGVKYTNTQYGRIKIVKAMDTEGPLSGWKFKITDSNGKEVSGSPFTSGEDGTITTGKLAPGKYTVEELIPKDSLYYCKSNNPQTITVTAGKTAQVKFTNALRPGKIAILKVDTFGEPLAGAKFCLEWSADGKTWIPIKYEDSKDVVRGCCSNSAVKDGCLTTGKDGKIQWDTLHPGMYYRITEAEAPEGYSLLPGYAFEGTLPIDDVTVTLRVVNTPVFTLPKTGSYAPVLRPAALVLCLGICLCAVLTLQKRRTN